MCLLYVGRTVLLIWELAPPVFATGGTVLVCQDVRPHPPKCPLSAPPGAGPGRAGPGRGVKCTPVRSPNSIKLRQQQRLQQRRQQLNPGFRWQTRAVRHAISAEIRLSHRTRTP